MWSALVVWMFKKMREITYLLMCFREKNCYVERTNVAKKWRDYIRNDVGWVKSWRNGKKKKKLWRVLTENNKYTKPIKSILITSKNWQTVSLVFIRRRTEKREANMDDQEEHSHSLCQCSSPAAPNSGKEISICEGKVCL